MKNIANLMSLPTDTVHEVRFLPNHKNPSESITMLEKYLDPDNDECTSSEFALWRDLGEKSIHHMIKYHANALLNGKPVVLFFGRSMKKVIDSIMRGDSQVYASSITPLMEPTNPFDLQNNLSIRFMVVNMPGTPIKKLEITDLVRDPKNIIFEQPSPEESIVSVETRKAKVMSFFRENFEELHHV